MASEKMDRFENMTLVLIADNVIATSYLGGGSVKGT